MGEKSKHMFGFLKRREKEDDFSLDRNESLKAYIPREERENSYKEALITTNTGYKVRGIVLDHSEGGVRMRFKTIEALPEIVYISIPAFNIHTRARVAWQDTIDYGLEYIEPLKQ